MKHLLLVLCLVLPAATEASARTWYVKPDGTGDAPTIQAAVDSAGSGDTVLVADGTYTWANQGSGGSLGLIRVRLGTASSICIRGESGDPSEVVLDAQQNGRVMFCDIDALIEGITFTGGVALWSMSDSCDANGGGLCLGGLGRGCTVQVARCIFSGDSAESCGGGLSYDAHDYVTITDCVFEANSSGQMGGGVYVGHGWTNMADCLFLGNKGAHGGGGCCLCNFDLYGAAVSSCAFLENLSSSHGAGGLHLERSAPVTLAGCIFGGNIGVHAGGLFCIQSAVTVSSATFCGNTSYSAGGALYSGSSSVEIGHSIISFSPAGSAVSGDGSGVSLTCCDLYGNAGGDWVGSIAGQFGINGNLSADPLFCSRANGDYALANNSPCAPENSPSGCGLIGVLPVNCDCAGVPAGHGRSTTWGSIKAQFK
jgi:predicted outer membrane repeat protein